MMKYRRIAGIVLAAILILGLATARVTSAALAHPAASTTSFHFVFSADSRGNYTVLPDFSHKMVTFSPVFGFFGGDLCTTLDTTCINNQWKPAMDGNNHDGMLARTFVGRGNHDAGTLSTWQGLWNFAAMAGSVGATHYTAQTTDATYSFDYGNSHFAVVDNPSSGAAGWTSSQIAWLDNDLSAAENRGAAHEFLISHGPMYTVTSEHAGDLPSSALKTVLNKHPLLIGFHGHEHITAYTLVTPSFESGINSYPQFTLGRAGAPAYSISKPVTWSASQNAFADVAVSGSTVTVTVYSQAGSALFTRTFSKTPHIFADVPVAGQEWMEPWIVAFYNAGITSGCAANPLRYCPGQDVTREEMAVFLLRARHGAQYQPPARSHFFSDMPVSGKEWMEPWVDEFYREGMTSGCGSGKFCPTASVTRAEMAVFILRALHGASWTPPSAKDPFSDVPVAGKEWMEPWIDAFYYAGITSGCGSGMYCPENNVTRAEMAVFIGRAYNLHP